MEDHHHQTTNGTQVGGGDSRKRKAVQGADGAQYAVASTSARNLSLSEDDLRRLIGPLSREQMLSLLTTYCMVHEDLYTATLDLVQTTPASRRLMIRNIAFTTTDDVFRAMFQEIGEVEDCTIVRDRGTTKSKGFGFVTFKDLEAVGKALKQTFEVDGREWAVKLASDPSGMESTTTTSSTGGRCKLFIRNLSDETTDSRLLVEFSSYGSIQEAVVVKDPATGKSKGYGFVSFANSEDAAKALQQAQRVIDGRMAFITLATPSGHMRGSGGSSSTAAAAAAAASLMPMVSPRPPAPPQAPMQLSAGMQQQYLVQQQQQQLAQNYAAQLQALQAQQPTAPPPPPPPHPRMPQQQPQQLTPLQAQQLQQMQQLQSQQQYAYLTAASAMGLQQSLPSAAAAPALASAAQVVPSQLASNLG